MAQLPANVHKIGKALKGTRAVYSIAKHPNLRLFADGKGSGSWRIVYRTAPGRGAPQRWHTLTNDARHADFHEVARKAADLLNNLSVHGIDPRSTRPNATTTFNTVFAQWLTRYARAHKKSWEADEKLYHRHVKKRIGTDLLAVIDRQRVIAVLDAIADAATPLQANRCQSLISAVMSWALDEGLIKAHPALRIRRRGAETARELVMTDDQLRTFWQKLDKLENKPATIIKLLLLTGTRLSEVAEASVSELRLNDAEAVWSIPAQRTKNGVAHILPLAPLARQLFAEAIARAGHSPFVFPARRIEPAPYDGNHASRLCKAIFRDVGAPDMRLHDLRHQVATGMAQCGVPLDIRQWVQNQITGRRQSIGSVYDQHDYTAEKLRALTLWEARLAAIIEGRPVPMERY